MNKEVEEFQQYVIAEAKSKNKNPEQYVKELGKDGLKEAYKRFQEHKKKQARKALHGAKLQYFKSLKNQCADDEQLVYYKKGGVVNCGCEKKEGGKVEKKQESVVDRFKATKAQSGSKMMQLVEANKKRKAEEDKKKAFEEKWKKGQIIIGKDIQKGDKPTKKAQQDSAVPNEDIPSYDRFKKSKKGNCGIKVSCGGSKVVK